MCAKIIEPPISEKDRAYAKGFAEGSIVASARVVAAVARNLDIDAEKIVAMVDLDPAVRKEILLLAKYV